MRGIDALWSSNAENGWSEIMDFTTKIENHEWKLHFHLIRKMWLWILIMWICWCCKTMNRRSMMSIVDRYDGKGMSLAGKGGAVDFCVDKLLILAIDFNQISWHYDWWLDVMCRGDWGLFNGMDFQLFRWWSARVFWFFFFF